MDITILGIESSCDDTSAAVIRNNLLLSNVIASQAVHIKYGGVIPELASRAHQQNIIPVVDTALREAGLTVAEIDAIAFTRGPGLLGSLLVGVSFAKGLSVAHDIPMVEVNHLQGHILSHFIDLPDREVPHPGFPFLCLLVSGGHTQIVRVDSPLDMEIIGTTIDDAAGEAFDKCAKVMALPYPGGPVIDRLAKEGNPKAFRLAHPHVDGYDYSFSGLKTSFLYMLRDAVADHPDVYDIDFIPNEFFRADDNCTFVGFRNQIKKAREAGYKLPVERTIFMTGMAPDEWWVNMSRVNGIDATDPAQYTQGEIICAEQNEEIVRYLKAYIPGFENAYVDRVAPFMGIRETRRIVGEYILTEDDIFNCARFDDVIAVASYPVDLHHPVGGDCSLYWCPDCYDIPYRCLIPQKIDGLIVAGRNVSMTHLALASARVMAPAMALGEAAGKAAALSVKENVELRDLDVRKLQESLKAEGVYFRE